MFEAFGFAERVLKEAYWVNETSFWKPDDTDRSRIMRSGRVDDTEQGLSEFPHVILNQARVHQFYLDTMRNAPTRLEPHYGRRLLDLTVDQDAPDHPVTVRLERLDAGHEGEVETVRARYVVGCDGARSTVRKSIGRTLQGDSANHAWGVMDVLAVTDFPDIRLKSLIQSAGEGSIVLIPREGGDERRREFFARQAPAVASGALHTDDAHRYSPTRPPGRLPAARLPHRRDGPDVRPVAVRDQGHGEADHPP